MTSENAPDAFNTSQPPRDRMSEFLDACGVPMPATEERRQAVEDAFDSLEIVQELQRTGAVTRELEGLRSKVVEAARSLRADLTALFHAERDRGAVPMLPNNARLIRQLEQLEKRAIVVRDAAALVNVRKKADFYVGALADLFNAACGRPTAIWDDDLNETRGPFPDFVSKATTYLGIKPFAPNTVKASLKKWRRDNGQ